MQELRELRERVDDFPVTPEPAVDSMAEVVIKKDPARTQGKRQPNVFSKYDGNKTNYPAWRRAVLAALRMGWNTFKYTNSSVFLMIYMSLEGVAKDQAGGFFEAGGHNGKEDPKDFFAYPVRTEKSGIRQESFEHGGN